MTETQTETSGRQKQHICCSLKVGTTCKGLLSKSLSYIRKVFLCPSPSHPFFFWRMFKLWHLPLPPSPRLGVQKQSFPCVCFVVMLRPKVVCSSVIIMSSASLLWSLSKPIHGDFMSLVVCLMLYWINHVDDDNYTSKPTSWPLIDRSSANEPQTKTAVQTHIVKRKYRTWV